jgi:sugar lactone lactonase YvrE
MMMKRLIYFLSVMSLSLSVFSQTKMIINKNNGTADSVLLSEIKNITFTLSGSTTIPSENILYVTNEGNGGGGTTILKILMDGSTSIVGTGFNGPAGLAIHPGSKDLYISDDYGAVYRIQSNGASTRMKDGFSNPNGLAFDSHNRLLIAEAGTSITRLDLTTDSVKLLATGFNTPQAVGEYNGQVFFTDMTGYLYVIRESDNIPITAPAIENRYISDAVAAGTMGGLVIDHNGNIFIANGSGKVVKVSTSDQSVTTIFDNSNVSTRGLALSPAQDILFVTGYYSQEIIAINLNTNRSTVLSNSAISQGLLNGPFGMAVTNTNFVDFVRPSTAK